jgi:hypothetical protein
MISEAIMDPNPDVIVIVSSGEEEDVDLMSSGEEGIVDLVSSDEEGIVDLMSSDESSQLFGAVGRGKRPLGASGPGASKKTKRAQANTGSTSQYCPLDAAGITPAMLAKAFANVDILKTRAMQAWSNRLHGLKHDFLALFNAYSTKGSDSERKRAAEELQEIVDRFRDCVAREGVRPGGSHVTASDLGATDWKECMVGLKTRFLRMVSVYSRDCGPEIQASVLASMQSFASKLKDAAAEP